MTQALAYANPEVLRWARESVGYTIEDAAEKIGVKRYTLYAVEEGAELLTLRQAEAAAEVYERSLATLLRPEPPQEEEQRAIFRRLPGAPEPPWPPEMRLLVRRIRERQDAAAQIYEELDESPLWPATVARLRRPSDSDLAVRARSMLGSLQSCRSRGGRWTVTRRFGAGETPSRVLGCS
jgi:transcriptional regulator with XRE-family HTH domain